MADAATEQLVAQCPNCGKSYAVRADQKGKPAKCKQCSESFIIDPKARQAVASPPPAPGEALLCPICQSPVLAADTTTACPACKTAHHTECWEYNKGCGLYGCKQSPETEKLQDIEIPASYWGQTEKKCPRCGNAIQAAAVRCRFCGETFETARPQDVVEFVTQGQQKAAVATHRKIGIVMLIFAILPCTAPLTLVVGGIWYLLARKTIAAMPPLQATICRLAVGIAGAVTLFIIVVAAIYSVAK